MRLKDVGLMLFTCTWIEIMTGAGLTLYLILVMHNYVLAALSAGLFAHLIVFHVVVTLLPRKDDLISIERTQRTNGKLVSKMTMLED